MKENDALTLTDSERKLILAIRDTKLQNGRIPCLIFIQDGKMVRVELTEAVRSVKLS